MRFIRVLKRIVIDITRSRELLEGVVAGLDNEQRLLSDKLDKVIEIQHAQLASQRIQIDMIEELMKDVLAREGLRFQTIIENQNAQLGFQRAQIEMIGEVLKAAID